MTYIAEVQRKFQLALGDNPDKLIDWNQFALKLIDIGDKNLEEDIINSENSTYRKKTRIPKIYSDKLFANEKLSQKQKLKILDGWNVQNSKKTDPHLAFKPDDWATVVRKDLMFTGLLEEDNDSLTNLTPFKSSQNNLKKKKTPTKEEPTPKPKTPAKTKQLAQKSRKTKNAEVIVNNINKSKV